MKANKSGSVVSSGRRRFVAGVACVVPAAYATLILGADIPAQAKGIAPGNHDTSALQAMIDAGVRSNVKVVIPAGKYFIDVDKGLHIPSNTTVVMEDGAELLAIPTKNSSYSVVNINNAHNVTLIGGRIVGERAHHLGHGGEWGMGINIRGSSNIMIRGTSVSDCWGDGFYLGMGSDKRTPCKDISISNVKSFNNRRQGISIVACIGAKITDSEFENTNGTAPASGIDLEPNGSDPVKNVSISGCKVIGNAGCGIQTANRVDELVIERCTVSGNGRSAIMLHGYVSDVSILDCIIAADHDAAIYVDKRAKMPMLRGNTLTRGPHAVGLKVM